ncbi:hypothetical protein WJX72_002775 [[Myrmecia] bisecta]|uniref:Uncharacterized protein n=1 Tax=[Myrmecia] bisecta TaxID=41462 RepID=A0AAW1R570_9CHLO
MASCLPTRWILLAAATSWVLLLPVCVATLDPETGTGHPEVLFFTSANTTQPPSKAYRYYQNVTASRLTTCFNNAAVEPVPPPAIIAAKAVKYAAYFSNTYTGPTHNQTILYLYSTYDCPEDARIATYQEGTHIVDTPLRVASWNVYYPPGSDYEDPAITASLPKLPAGRK